MKKTFCIIILVFGISFYILSAQAALKTTNSEYKILIHGITLARLSFKTEINGNHYKISGNVRSSALADIIGKTRGQTTVIGKIEPTHLQAKEYSLNYTNSKGKKALSVEFDANGKVLKSTVLPKPKTPPSDWVALEEKDLLSVVDPVSSLTFPFNSPVCSRTVSIFNGEARIDLKLVRKGSRRFKTEGFKGTVIVCNVQFLPKGGYRSEHDSVKYLMNSDEMEIWFGKNEDLRAYIPVFAKIPTRIGNVRVWATRIGS